MGDAIHEQYHYLHYELFQNQVSRITIFRISVIITLKVGNCYILALIMYFISKSYDRLAFAASTISSPSFRLRNANGGLKSDSFGSVPLCEWLCFVRSVISKKNTVYHFLFIALTISFFKIIKRYNWPSPEKHHII